MNGIKIKGYLSHGGINTHTCSANGIQNGVDATFTKFTMTNGANQITGFNNSSAYAGQILTVCADVKTKLINGTGNLILSSNQYTLNENVYMTLIYNGSDWVELNRSHPPVRYAFGGGANGSYQYLGYNSFGTYNLGARTRASNLRNGHVEKYEFIIGDVAPTGNLEIRVNNSVSQTITSAMLIANSVVDNNDRVGSVDLNVSVQAGDSLEIKCDNANYSHITGMLVVT
jgi:hypothetical protein